jgi:hypothetical protein
VLAGLLAAALTPQAAVVAAPAARFVDVRLGTAQTIGRVDALAVSRLAGVASARSQPPASNALPSADAPTARIVSPSGAPLPLTVSRTVYAQSHTDVLLEPPDPWVAANGSYVLASSNGLVRVMNRTGSVLANIPTVTLFATDGAHSESDPRIIWDPAHRRWLGVVVTFDDASADTSLTLAVSDTANPLGAWAVHRLGYRSYLPDFPGIATTTDEVVLTANLMLLGETYSGTSVQLVDWASLLKGGTTASDVLLCSTCWNLRPARNSGAPSATGYLVYETPSSLDPTNSNQVVLTTVTGPAAVISRGPDEDLGITAGPDTFTRGPRQPGGPMQDPNSSDLPIDSRINDVAMNGDKLFFARTMMAEQGGDAPEFVVEVYTVSVSGALAGAPATTLTTVGTAGVDDWMPGVGISSGDPGAGTGFFLTYMRSSATEAPTALAAASLDGVTFTDPAIVATSLAPYTGIYQRWGDFMGITPDPGGTMAVWSATEISGSDGGWQEVVDRLVLDGTPPPSPAGTPTETLVAGTQLGAGTVPVEVAFAPTTDPESGIRNYIVNNTSTDIAVTVPGTSLIVSVAAVTPGTLTSAPDSFQVVAVNDAGLPADASGSSSPLTATVFDQTRAPVAFSRGWTTRSGTGYAGGSVRFSSTPGASVSIRANGSSFAWVSERAAGRGRARVYVDGTLRATIRLSSSISKPRSIPFAIAFDAPGTHTIRIVVVGGRVDVDAFVVLG